MTTTTSLVLCFTEPIHSHPEGTATRVRCQGWLAIYFGKRDMPFSLACETNIKGESRYTRITVLGIPESDIDAVIELLNKNLQSFRLKDASGGDAKVARMPE